MTLIFCHLKGIISEEFMPKWSLNFSWFKSNCEGCGDKTNKQADRQQTDRQDTNLSPIIRSGRIKHTSIPIFDITNFITIGVF